MSRAHADSGHKADLTWLERMRREWDSGEGDVTDRVFCDGFIHSLEECLRKAGVPVPEWTPQKRDR